MKSGLLTIGLTTLDIVARPVDALTHTERAILVDGIACVPAGTAGGAAMVAATLGVPTTIVGAVGDDLIGRFVRLGFESVGIDTRLLVARPGERTSTTLLTVESDGRRSSYHAAGAGGGASITDAVVAAACASGFVHYAAVGGRETDRGAGADLLKAAKAAGAVVTCDLISPRNSAREELPRLLPYVDYFMPSAAEAIFLSGAEDLGVAAELFRSLGAGACIIKNGGQGSYVALGDQRRTVPAHVIQPIDTTSCGDSYCAGFIAALSRGWAPLDACRFATATAGLVAQGLGTLGKLQGFAKTEKVMREAALSDG
ncbi:MAG TPA: PfkB family carbohydrate kinase [Caulobacteraceae bacterium]|nr:PfkB family carbohydrate kinase [Caulobacteraceae bacterium]